MDQQGSRDDGTWTGQRHIPRNPSSATDPPSALVLSISRARSRALSATLPHSSASSQLYMDTIMRVVSSLACLESGGYREDGREASDCRLNVLGPSLQALNR